MELLATLFFGFAPMFLFAAILYWLDHYEKEPKFMLIGVFLWGVIVAAGGAYILNTVFGVGVYLLSGDELLSEVTTASLSAPFVEEILKGLAVVLVFLVARKEFDSILDGIVYAGIAALGFAATENTIYIWRGYEEGGWEGLWQLVFIRVILVGWQHPFYTSFIGIGLALARTSSSGLVKFAAPLGGFGLAIFSHALHNFLLSVPLLGDLTCLLTTVLDWSGVLFMFILIFWAGWMEARNIVNHLREEVEMGLISVGQYRTASSMFGRAFASLGGFFSGQPFATGRFYQVAGELAHKKEQLRKHGEESGNSELVKQYREELARLAPAARA